MTGASEGRRVAHAIMTRDNNTARIIPGTTPAMSSLPIDVSVIIP